jgi:hypothetical protein
MSPEIDHALNMAQRLVGHAVGVEEAFNPSEYLVSEADFLALARALTAVDEMPPSPLPAIGITSTDDTFMVCLDRKEHHIEIEIPRGGVGAVEFFYLNHATNAMLDVDLPDNVGEALMHVFGILREEDV